ncbi:MAG: GTPase ObgE [Endomicrobiales bacterium]|nr:GTPase ObgE [Endomicrobiales bacterium]
MFVDKVRIYITAGRGGDGCISFRREKFIPLGGPDGGNGGKGGDVYLEADPHLKSLLDFSYKPHYKAQSGSAGRGSDKYGRGALDLIIKVPLGTMVYDKNRFVADLKEQGQKILIAKGGRGGRGNASYKTSRNTAPRISEKGEPGQEVTLDLELKLIADVGLVGFPNAGKSTFLSRVTAARPKIADYPFTTLSPNLGVARFKDTSFVIADIPGIIEGAHEGKGLGDEFLRHIQRTRVLIHIVDLFEYDGRPAYKNYLAINRELSEYSKSLLNPLMRGLKLDKKPMLIAANKMDLTDADKKLKEFKKNLKRKKVFPISCITGKGIKELLTETFKMLEKTPVHEIADEPRKQYIYKPDFVINKKQDVFIITGDKIERIAEMTNFEQQESLMHFQTVLKDMGIDKALKDKGIEIGNTVKIGKQEFTYE